MAKTNHQHTNSTDVHHVAADDRRVQDVDGDGGRPVPPFHSMLEAEVFQGSWNLELAFAPVSSFSGEGEQSGSENYQQQATIYRAHHLHPIRIDTLSERLALLSMPRKHETTLDSNIPNEMVQALPNEVLMLIFSFLDDISLYAVGNVCRRWHQLLVSQTTSDQWQIYTRKRWPLFRPFYRVPDWFTIYSTLVSRTCIQISGILYTVLVRNPFRAI